MKKATALAASIAALVLAAPAFAAWMPIYFVDEWGDRTDSKGVQSADRISVDVGMHDTSCSLVIGKGWSRLACTYLNLVGGDFVGRDGTRVYDIDMRVSGHSGSFRAEQYATAKALEFGQDMTDYLIAAAKRDKNSTLQIRLPYYQAGRTIIEFPLSGLEAALVEAGLI